MCRSAGAWSLLFAPTHRLRGGLGSFAPAALGQGGAMVLVHIMDDPGARSCALIRTLVDQEAALFNGKTDHLSAAYHVAHRRGGLMDGGFGVDHHPRVVRQRPHPHLTASLTGPLSPPSRPAL